MNFKNILQEIEKSDPEVFEKLSPRRHALKSFGAKVAVATLPFAIGSLFKKAYGSTSAPTAVLDALNFALQLEFLEYNFYHQANNTGSNTTTTLVPSADAPGFVTIEAQERDHIIFLMDAITTLGGVPKTPPNYNATATNPYYIPEGTYDFTAGGVYNTFSDYNTFLTIAQIFEDTGVRGYNGQLPNLIGTAGVLTQAMQIQAVEARHAAHIRLVRRFAGALEQPRPWITNNIAPINTPTINGEQSIYTGEDNVTQSGINITTLPDKYDNPATIPMAAATEAFDEPISSTTIASYIAQFMP